MKIGKQIYSCVVLGLCLGGACLASETGGNVSEKQARGPFTFLRNKPCTKPYKQLAVSPPLQRTSSIDKGYPWRSLYGYCVGQFGRTALHQDWVISYLDATEQGDSPGGNGVSLGTDFGFQWRPGNDGHIATYYEVGAGLQYAAGTAFPAHGSRWMFTINAGLGVLFPLTSNVSMNVGIRHLHISNAGLMSRNAGYDALHLLVGVRW